MTAEVAVMNTMAVALAADSAVTMGKDKIFNTANKLFELSRINSIGIMIYGAAQLMGIPWETIIKEYRSSIGCRCFETLEECANDFCQEVKKSINSEIRMQSVKDDLSGFYEYVIVRGIKKKIQEYIDLHGSIRKSTVKAVIERIINIWHERFKARPPSSFASDEYRKIIKEKYSDLAIEIIKEIFDKLPLTKGQNKILVNMGIDLYCKDLFGKVSGIAIAGFGKEDIYPSLREYQIHTIAGEELKSTRYIRVDHNNTASIVAFAQSEMVHTFMQGVDPHYNKNMEDLLGEFFDKFGDFLKNNIPNKEFADKLNVFLKSKKDEFKEALKSYRLEHNIQPILVAVSSLPKEDLVALAESLVHLTSLKKKVSADQTETVGGPIDVAVISKGDGFIWIKRKHYFEANLNPLYFIRLLSKSLTSKEDNYVKESKKGKGI